VRTEAVGRTDAGRVRPNNEDAFLVRDDLTLYVVADGMGGAAAGEIASQIFVQTAEEVFLNGLKRGMDRASLVLAVFEVAHERIKDDARRRPPHSGMGCTAEILTFEKDRYYLGHVGDSRTYLWDGRILHLLTRDHTYVQQQLEDGVISDEEARHHRLRHILSRAVGHEDTIEVDQPSGFVRPGALFLLCSDGLTGELTDDEIVKALQRYNTVAERADCLLSNAREAGGRDNITVVLSRVIGEPGSEGAFGATRRWGQRWQK
jgi:serine/threonine protein phosphatase PrpC